MLFDKKQVTPQVADATLANELTALNYKHEALSRRFDVHLSHCVHSDTLEEIRETALQIRTDYSAFAENLGRRMSSMETIQRELLSKTYEYDRILHALGVKITARADGGQRVAPLAPEKGEDVS